MALFHPPFLTCPRCHQPTSGLNTWPTAGYVETGAGKLRSSRCGHEFQRQEAIKTLVDFSRHKVLLAFSHWCHNVVARVSVGNISRIELPVPDGYSVFAAPLPAAVMGDGEHHFFPHLFMIDKKWLSIGTTAHELPSNNPVGTEMEFLVEAYAFDAADAPGWKRLLYESLSDLSELRWDLSVFKLETAVHLYADLIFESYLAQKLDRRVARQILRRLRSWDDREKSIKYIYLAELDGGIENQIDEIFGGYKKHVKEPRNSLAHDKPKPIHPDRAHDAFKAAFEVLWMLDELDKVLSN